MPPSGARTITFDIDSLRVTLIALDQTRIPVRQAAEGALSAAGAVALKHVKKAIGLRDHSLTDLAAIDHPYAKRHGAIRIHTDAPWQVHRDPTSRPPSHKQQTGNLFKNTEGRKIVMPSGAPGFEVYFDVNDAPEAIAVTQGTKLMLPRDPMWNAVNAPGVREEMMKAIVVRLGRDLRSKMGIRFGQGMPTPRGGTSVS